MQRGVVPFDYMTLLLGETASMTILLGERFLLEAREGTYPEHLEESRAARKKNRLDMAKAVRKRDKREENPREHKRMWSRQVMWIMG